MKSRKGFTLAELLIVVAIIGILVAIGIPVFNGRLEKARRAVDLDNARSIYTSIGAAVNSGDLVIGESQYIVLIFYNDSSIKYKGVDGAADFNNAATAISYRGKYYGPDNFPGPKDRGKGVTISFAGAVLKDYGIDIYHVLSQQKKNKWYAVQVSFTGGLKSGFCEGDTTTSPGKILGSSGIKDEYFDVVFS